MRTLVVTKGVQRMKPAWRRVKSWIQGRLKIKESARKKAIDATCWPALLWGREAFSYREAEIARTQSAANKVSSYVTRMGLKKLQETAASAAALRARRGFSTAREMTDERFVRYDGHLARREEGHVAKK